MPRAFDSDRDPEALVFTENVDCPVCGEVFEGQFEDRTRSLSVEDMVDTPIGDHQCPECGQEFSSLLSGWMFYSEAG